MSQQSPQGPQQWSSQQQPQYPQQQSPQGYYQQPQQTQSKYKYQTDASGYLPAQNVKPRQRFVQPQYSGYQEQYVANQPATTLRVLYGVVGLGILLVVVGVFLPWVNADVSIYGSKISINMNGIGSVGGDPLISALAQQGSSSSSSTTLKDGIVVLVGAVPLAFLAIFGLIKLDSRYAIGTLIFGGLGLLFYGYEWFNTNRQLSGYSSSDPSITASVSTGIGLLIGFVGCLLVVALSISILVSHKR